MEPIRWSDKRLSLPLIAGAVNGGLVLLMPLTEALRAAVLAGPLTLPLAAVAGWRTVVHALRPKGHWSLQPILEAAATGSALVFLLLLPGVTVAAVVHKSLVGFAAMFAYVTIGAVAGVCIGLLLQLTAAVVLRMASRRRSQP